MLCEDVAARLVLCGKRLLPFSFGVSCHIEKLAETNSICR